MSWLRFVVAVSALSLGVSSRADPLDDFVAAEMKTLNIPGLAFGIARHGEPLIVRAAGLRNVEAKLKVEADTPFNIGSITKQFTATAILMLHEEGKLGLDDPIAKHLPELRDKHGTTTLRQTLNHVGGFSDWSGVRGFVFREEIAEADFLKLVAGTEPAQAPGSKFVYSNVGYALLGIVVGRVSGTGYVPFVQERVFKRLGLSATTFVPAQDWPSNWAVGYRWRENAWTPGSIRRAAVTASSGAGVSTVGDLLKLDAALHKGEVVSKASFEQQTREATLADGKKTEYGMGWGVGRTAGGELASMIHAGSTVAGFRSVMRRDLRTGFSVVLLTNLGGEWDQTALARRIFEKYRALNPLSEAVLRGAH